MVKQLALDLDKPEPAVIHPVDPNVESEPARLSRQSSAILERLRRGPATNTELIVMAQRFGARLHDLRKAGYQISTNLIDTENGIYLYTLEAQ